MPTESAAPHRVGEMSPARGRVSVCMATYNGARFIREQLESIIEQLGVDDELIVVDDGSTDDTLRLVESFADSRISVYRNERNLGSCATFARGVSLATGDVIFTSDQDDIWIPGRLDAMRSALIGSGAMLVTSNLERIDSAGGRAEPLPLPPLKSEDSDRNAANLLRILAGRAAYFGCTMAFRSSFREIVLPVPGYVKAHDIWFATAANLIGRNFHLEDVTLQHRVHGGNLSFRRRGLMAKLITRIRFIASMVQLGIRTQFSPRTAKGEGHS